MQPTKILDIAAYRRQPWPEHTRRVVAASMVNLGLRRRRRHRPLWLAWTLVIVLPWLATAVLIGAGSAIETALR